MEEGREGVAQGFFPLLNSHFPGVVDDLLANHRKLEQHDKAIQQAMTSGDFEMIKKAYADFQELNYTHLKQEEDVMMPKVPAMKEKGVNLMEAMKNNMFAIAAVNNMEHFLGYGMRVLERHHENMPRARVFAHAIYAVSTEEQWNEWHYLV